MTASDDFELGGYRADPPGTPKGGLVVIQEIFGVNHHIRNVCDRFAAQGYAAVAPAVFDRIEPNFECGYSPAEVEHARTFIPKIDWAAMMHDTAAAIDAVKDAGKVGIVGYCMGGSVAFLAACNLDGLSCAIGYYGGAIAKNADKKPKVPTLLHFGDQDQSIPMSDVEIVKRSGPTARSTSTMRVTAFRATSAAASTRPPTRRRSVARSPGSRAMLADRGLCRAPAPALPPPRPPSC